MHLSFTFGVYCKWYCKKAKAFLHTEDDSVVYVDLVSYNIDFNMSTKSVFVYS